MPDKIEVPEELLSDIAEELRNYLWEQINRRQSAYLPPDHLCGAAKTSERDAYYWTSTDPELLKMITSIETLIQTSEKE